MFKTEVLAGPRRDVMIPRRLMIMRLNEAVLAGDISQTYAAALALVVAWGFDDGTTGRAVAA